MPTQSQTRNIAQLSRGLYGLGCHSDVNKLVQELYGEPVRTLPTQKGEWRFYERTNYSIPTFLEEERQPPINGFCAIYRREHKNDVITTMFMGNLEDRAVVDSVADELARNVLEQRKWFAWPPYGLTESSGGRYGNLRGMTGLWVLEIGTVYFGREEQWFINASNSLFEYGKGLGLLAAVVIPMIGGIIVGSFVGKRLGKRADKMRVKNLPEEAYSFLYGKEAEKAIEDEGRIVSDEAIKERSYRLFRETLHLDIPKSDFLKLRGNLLANISPFSMD